MSQKNFITNADAALANHIWRAVEADQDTKKIVEAKEQISFSAPKATSAKAALKLSVYLYSVEVKDAAEKETVPFVLHYLVTPTTGDEKTDHVLLEKIVQALLATPQIGGADPANPVFFLKFDSFSPSQESELWIALGVPLRPSVSLTVASAARLLGFSAENAIVTATPQAAQATPAVNDVALLYQAVLKTFVEQSDGWKSRNLFLKQFVFQQFKKIAGLTVDEMLAALRGLGDKLDAHKPTDEFIKPLNQLASYYERQLDELKGMDKVSHNQKENLEAVEVWLKEVKELIEALSTKT